MAYEPKITLYFDQKPTERAEVLFESFAAGTARATVYITVAGRQSEVRGAINARVAGALTRIDMQIPFGVPVTYHAEMFDSAGVSLGLTGSTTKTFNVKATSLHNPLDPQNAVHVIMASTAAGSISRPVPGSVIHPLNRHVGVVVSGTRQGVTGVVMDCYTESDADADKVAAMFGGYSGKTVPVLCLRIGADVRMRIPRPFYAAVLDPREEAGAGSKIAWRMTGDEVSPPAPGIFIPLLTRADINAFYLTRAAVNSAHPTRLSVNRAYELIGAGNAGA